MNTLTLWTRIRWWLRNPFSSMSALFVDHYCERHGLEVTRRRPVMVCKCGPNEGCTSCPR